MTFICCVSGCGETGQRILHSFPKKQAQSKKWIEATWCFHLNAETAWKTHYKVCRKHFQQTDFKNWNLLKKDVVPSLMLPHSITMEHDYCTRNSLVMHIDEAEANYDKINLLEGTICHLQDHVMEAVAGRNKIDDFNLENQVNGNIMEVEESNKIEDFNLKNQVNVYECLLEENMGEENIGEQDMTEQEMSRDNDLNGNKFLFKNQLSGDGCLLEDIGEENAIGSMTDDQKSYISNNFLAANAHGYDMEGETATGSLTDDQKPCCSKMVSDANAQQIHKPKSSRTYNPVARKMRYLTDRNKALAKKLKDTEAANLKSNKKSKVKKKIESVLKTLSSELPPAQYNFIKLQIKNTGKAKKGNRFTFEEKTLVLVIYKQNPKRYKDLRKMSDLPTRQTLIAHSAAIRFKEGINQNLMDFIKKSIGNGRAGQSLYHWLDEISLTANLNFDQIKDYIDGFEDLGSKRTNNFATHALVFMVRGVKSPYKQPISYFLTENLQSAELAELVTLVISAVMDTGLKVIGSVSDAVGTNRAAVNKLIGGKRNRGKTTTGELLEYTINDVKIWHYFDPPHLIKSVRNNLMVKNLTHTVSFNEAKFRPDGTIVWNEKNKQQRTASWNDKQNFYEFNNNDKAGLFNLIPNITEEHMNPARRKMKVSLATQVFSGTYERNMCLCWKRKEFSNNCIGTAAILLFFNDLFDSVNGDNIPIPDTLLGALTKNSKHFIFWDYAIRMLDNMKFSENLETGNPNKSNVFQHFVSTLKALRRISEHLFELGLEKIALRRLNQDGLENHFFKIRSYCGSNKRPNPRDFRNSYTTSILNSQLSIHSLNANCEADEDSYMLQNLQTLFVQQEEAKSSFVCESDEHKPTIDPDSRDKNYLKVMSTLKDEMDVSEISFHEDEAQNCISGKICKKLLTKFKCASCAVTVTVTNTKKEKCQEHDIMRKQSSVDEIVLPKVQFIDCIKIIILKMQNMLPVLCTEKNITQKVLSGLSFENNNDELIGCDIHRIEFVNEMKKITAKLTIERFTQQVNRILTGKVTVAAEPIIQKKALELRNKRKHIGKYIAIAPQDLY